MSDRERIRLTPVSYTHLDVYKRQGEHRAGKTETTKRFGAVMYSENHNERLFAISRKCDKPVYYKHLMYSPDPAGGWCAETKWKLFYRF